MTLLKRRTKPVGLFPKMTTFSEMFDSWPMMDWKEEFFNEDKWVPAANVKDEGDQYIVELSVPGYKKEDVHVEVNTKGIMIISGQQKSESKEEKEKYMRREFSSGSFYRSFKLPESVKENEIVAKCENGLLHVVLPKLEPTDKEESVREIEIA